MSHLNFYPNLSVFEFSNPKCPIDLWRENATLKDLIWLIFKLCFEDHEFYEGVAHYDISSFFSCVYVACILDFVLL